MNFDLFCLNLGINIKEDANPLLLKKWFEDYLSHDQVIRGNKKEQWVQYKELIESYFQVLVPALKENPDTPLELLEGQSLISVLAQSGLDSLLLSLNPNSEALNKLNEEGQTPLHQAALNGWVHTGEALLSLGASPSIKNKNSQYPLFSTLLLPVVYPNSLKKNKILLFNLLQTLDPSIIAHQDHNRDTILHQMAIHDFGILMKEILANHPKLSFLKNNQSHYPIHTAILNQQISNVEMLLKIGSVEHLRDSQGAEPLHYAALIGNIQIIQLCGARSSLDIKDIEKRTPLMIAAQQGHLEAVQFLIKNGAQFDCKDSKGWTVLDYAVSSGNLELVQWLKDGL